MRRKEDNELIKKSSDTHISMNMTFILVVFAIIPFITIVSPEILQKDYFLTIQLILTVPFLISSSLARAKLGLVGNSKALDRLGFISFVLAYSCLINSLGIILSFFVPLFIVLIFFTVNIGMAIIYSLVVIATGQSKIKRRLIKDAFFIALILFLGILHVIGFY